MSINTKELILNAVYVIGGALVGVFGSMLVNRFVRNALIVTISAVVIPVVIAVAVLKGDKKVLFAIGGLVITVFTVVRTFIANKIPAVSQ